MNGKELQVLRKYLMLDVSEASEVIGKVSKRSWQYWEAGRSLVPDDVADKILGVLSQQRLLLERLEQDALAASDEPDGEEGKRLSLPYYPTLEHYQLGHPREGVLSWRCYQSVLAHLYAANLINIAHD